jgi:hypothetical protein
MWALKLLIVITILSGLVIIVDRSDMARLISWLVRWTIELWDDYRDPDWKRDAPLKCSESACSRASSTKLACAVRLARQPTMRRA